MSFHTGTKQIRFNTNRIINVIVVGLIVVPVKQLKKEKQQLTLKS